MMPRPFGPSGCAISRRDCWRLKLDFIVLFMASCAGGAWYTEEAIATLKEKLAQEIIRVYEGGQPVNIVNRNSLKGMETK